MTLKIHAWIPEGRDHSTIWVRAKKPEHEEFRTWCEANGIVLGLATIDFGTAAQGRAQDSDFAVWYRSEIDEDAIALIRLRW